MKQIFGSRGRPSIIVISVFASVLASSIIASPSYALDNLVIAREGLIRYQFTAVSGDALSRLARMAILCFTSEYSGQSYSDEQLTYAETSLVDRLGRRQLAIGESVTITSQQISDALLASQQLSPRTLEIWRTYSRQIDFQSVRRLAIDQVNDSQGSLVTSGSAIASSLVVSTNQATSDVWWYLASLECLLIIWLLFRR